MYNQIKVKMKNYLEKENVVSDLEVISLYDLQTAIENVLSDFFKVIDGTTIELYFKEKYGNNSNWLTHLLGFNNEKKNLSCSPWVNINNLNGNIELHLSFSEDFKSIPFNLITIEKKNGQDHLEFYEENYIEERKKFLIDNFEFIMRIFTILENFYNEFNIGYNGMSLGSLAKQEINDGFFKISLDYSNKIPSCNVSLLDKQENVAFRKKEADLPCLEDNFIKNRASYLKKIAISVSDLNPFFRKIVENNYQQNKTKSI